MPTHKLNVANGNTLEFKIGNKSYSGAILANSPHPILIDRVSFLVFVSGDVPPKSMVTFPNIPMSGNCGNTNDGFKGHGKLGISLPQTAIDLCTLTKAD